MHSTKFTAIARAADEFGFTIVASADRPDGEGVNPSAWCVLYDEDREPSRAYAFGMGIVETDFDNVRSWFGNTVYDCTFESAFRRLTDAVWVDQQ